MLVRRAYAFYCQEQGRWWWHAIILWWMWHNYYPFQGIVGNLEQGTASDTSKTQALLVEEFDKEDADDDNTQPTTLYTVFTGDGGLKKCLEWIHIQCEPGTLVSKFLFTTNKYNTIF